METLTSSSVGPSTSVTWRTCRDIHSLHRQVHWPTHWWLWRMTQCSMCRQSPYFLWVDSQISNGLMMWHKYARQRISMCRWSLTRDLFDVQMSVGACWKGNALQNTCTLLEFRYMAIIWLYTYRFPHFDMFVYYFMNYFVRLQTSHYTLLTISPISFIFDSARNSTRKLPYRPLWRFVKIPIAWRERRNTQWEKWLASRFTKCHLYTTHFSRFANIFSRSRQFDDKCIAGFTILEKMSTSFGTTFVEKDGLQRAGRRQLTTICHLRNATIVSWEITGKFQESQQNRT